MGISHEYHSAPRRARRGTVSGKLRFLGAVVAILLVSYAITAILEKGAETLQTAMQVPTSISDIVTGILLFCMLGCEFFINYRMIFRRKQAEAPAAPAAAESDQTESKEDASC